MCSNRKDGGGVNRRVCAAALSLDNRPADHHSDDLRVVGVLDGTRGDVAAVAHDRDAVADMAEFLQAMGDVDERRPPVLEAANDAEELFDLAFRDRSGRFVEDENAWRLGKRLGDLDHLLLGGAEIAYPRVRGDVDLEVAEHLGDALPGGTPVEPISPPERFIAEEDVFLDGHGRNQIEFLVDRADAERPRLTWTGDAHDLAADDDLPGVTGQGAAQNVDERRLAGAVLADQAVNLALAEFERKIVERPDAGKAHTQAAGRQGHFQGHFTPASRVARVL